MDTVPRAPDLPQDLRWLNAALPPVADALRGRVVLYWFFSADSPNCWNLATEIGGLEQRYRDGLVVIGLHCPRYPHHLEDAAVVDAIARMGIRHPVANDADFRAWKAFGITAWPTCVLVDAEGRLAMVVRGERCGAVLDERIRERLDDAAARDMRVFEPVAATRPIESGDVLAFPTRVLPDRERIFVADSGHHRVLECRFDGRVLRQFGSGIADFVDGDSAHACFRDPRGLALHGNALFVADRGNHAVRRIDLVDGSVSSILGDGEPGWSRPAPSDARGLRMSSPMDVAVRGERLFVAVAGQNQIWRVGLADGGVSIVAGSGEADLVDGDGGDAAFAQPASLAPLGRHLLVADAGANAIRFVGADDGHVQTLAGGGPYAFGDATGPFAQARFQHPLSVAVDVRGMIYVADTWNAAIKRLDRLEGRVSVLPLEWPLDEPQGLAVAAGTLWIANTRRHEVVRVDLPTLRARRVDIAE